jgi:1,4-dihydroxy-2-naphthoate octaprenyltransferase
MGRWSSKLVAWIRIQELHKHPVSLFPLLLGTAIAWYEAGAIDWRVFAAALAANYFITNGTYISNEYFDYETDRINVGRIGGESKVGVTTTGGTRVLVEGLLPRRHALIASILFFLAAVPIGALLCFHLGAGPLTIPVGVAALLIGWFYTAPPAKASYRGLGELFLCVGFTMPLLLGYYLQRGFSWLPLIVAPPYTLHTCAMKILREFPDYEADLAAGRRNLVVIFGRERMAKIYILLTACALTSFIPISFIVGATPALLLLLLPSYLLLKSLNVMIKGRWRSREGLEEACKDGFIGMLFIPLALTGIFILKRLLQC